jgi:methyl-accepting chemotaxis protein
MPAKKRPTQPSFQVILDEMRSHSLILEDMRSQNRAAIEEVAAARRALEERIERLDKDARARDSVLELAVRELRATVQQNSLDFRELKTGIQDVRAEVQQNGLDIRALVHKVQALASVEERVTALERRPD